MEPIVSPYIIYLISVLDKISLASVIVLGISLVSAFVCFIVSEDKFNEESTKATARQRFNKLCRVCIIATILIIVTPTRNVATQMLVLSYITPDNIETVKYEVIDIVKSIVSEINNIHF